MTPSAGVLKMDEAATEPTKALAPFGLTSASSSPADASKAASRPMCGCSANATAG